MASTIFGGNDDDRIYNSYGDVIILAGNASDYIDNKASNVTIDAGSGNDTIKNQDGNDVKIYGNSGEDVITNFSSYVTIDGGSGNDKVENQSGYHSKINGNEGDDSIKNFGDSFDLVIEGGTGDDVIENLTGNNSIINGGIGNDSIKNIGSNVTINAGNDNDTIINASADSVSIDGGAGDDVIDVYGENCIVRGNKGNDSVNVYVSPTTGQNNLSEYIFLYAPGDGDDVVSKGAAISLVGDAKITESLTSGKDVILKIGRGSITIKNSTKKEVLILNESNYQDYFSEYEVQNSQQGKIIKIQNNVRRKMLVTNNSDKSSIIGGARSDTIYNNGDNVLIDAGEGNNYISSYSQVGTIITYNGNDTIYTTSNSNDKNQIITGGGGDFVSNNGTNTLIDTGDGPDTVNTCSNSANNTINTGGGPDSINANGINTKINSGDGPDTIHNYGNGSEIDSGSDDDTIFNYANNVTFKNPSGNDTIYGFNETCLLDIDADNCTICAFGNDILIMTESGSMLLKDAGGLISKIPDCIIDKSLGIDYMKYNGTDSSEYSEQTQSQQEQIKNELNEFNEQQMQDFLNDDDIKDVLENGENSEVLQDMPEGRRKEYVDSVKFIYDMLCTLRNESLLNIGVSDLISAFYSGKGITEKITLLKDVKPNSYIDYISYNKEFKRYAVFERIMKNFQNMAPNAYEKWLKNPNRYQVNEPDIEDFRRSVWQKIENSSKKFSFSSKYKDAKNVVDSVIKNAEATKIIKSGNFFDKFMVGFDAAVLGSELVTANKDWQEAWQDSEADAHNLLEHVAQAYNEFKDNHSEKYDKIGESAVNLAGSHNFLCIFSKAKNLVI